MFKTICCILLICCASLSSQELNYNALTISPDLRENANAVVRLDEMTVDLLAVDEMRIRLKRVVTVLNKSGNRHAGARVGYNNSFKVRNAEALIYDAFGNATNKFRMKEFQDVSAVEGGTLYSDSRVLVLDYTPVQYPYTLEFTYEVSTSNTANIPSWYFLDGFHVSTEKSLFQINYKEPALQPVILEKNTGHLGLMTSATANSMRFEALNIRAIKDESQSPSFRTIVPHLMVRLSNFEYEGHRAFAENWKDIGSWVQTTLLKDRNVLPEATLLKARSLVAQVTDTLEKARIIYKYVQDNTRYISVQVGIGGLQPITASDVDRLKYGDCKGLSNYTMALLESVGVTAYYSIVQAGSEKVDFEEEFADLAQGNHIILAIPYGGVYHWIDCTSSVLPFGFVGDFTDDRKVLVVKPEGSQLLRTPAYVDKDNHQKTTADYTLNEKGGIEGAIDIVTSGIQYDQRLYLEKNTPEEVDMHYKNYWENINNLQLDSYRFENKKEDIRFNESLRVHADHYASISGNRILFVPNSFNKNTFIPTRQRSRVLPLYINRGFWDEDEFTIRLPGGYEIEAMPTEKVITSEFGQYSMGITYNDADHSLQFRRSFFLKEGTYGSDRYDAYRDFRKEVAGMDGAQVVIVKQVQ